MELDESLLNFDIEYTELIGIKQGPAASDASSRILGHILL